MNISQVELKPDLTATGFSAQNAYFFSMMSKIVYSPKLEVEGAIKGNATNKGLELGFDHFFWFEVRYYRETHVAQRASLREMGVPDMLILTAVLPQQMLL